MTRTQWNVTLFSATSRTDEHRLERMTEQTCETCWLSVDIEGRPERGSSILNWNSAILEPFVSVVCLGPMVSLSKACFNIYKVSVKVFPILTQKFNTHSLFMEMSFSKKKKKLPNVLHMHSLKDA
jgi:hypothetical protein